MTSKACGILEASIREYRPIKALLLFSGGHDSLVSTHIAADYFREIDFPFEVYHGDTTICIKETRDFVIQTCDKHEWPLHIGSPSPGETYEDIVMEYGFPGPNPAAHAIMYRRLKERALRYYVTHVVKSSPRARQNVLLVSGARQSESRIRMGYKNAVRKEDSRVWTAPIFYFQKRDVEDYMKYWNLLRNKVKDRIGISGECLCGCFADKGEYDKLCQHYPEASEEIDRLHEIAKANGKPWFWTQGPKEWEKLHPKGQAELFDLGMCSTCSRIS